MPFVNEFISEQDTKKYRIQEIDDGDSPVGVLAGSGRNRGTEPAEYCPEYRSWTIDRERDIYLRQVGSGIFEFSMHSGWTLYWKGDLIWFAREFIETIRGGTSKVPSVCLHIRVYNMHIPDHLLKHRDQIFKDIEEAFIVYRQGGLYDPLRTDEISLQIDFEL